MLASIRWRPQAAVGEGLNTGAPLRGVIWSTSGAAGRGAARGVGVRDLDPRASVALGSFTPVIVIAVAIVVPGANGALGLIGVIGAEPPPSAAGLVQSTSRPRGARAPEHRVLGRRRVEDRERDTQPIWRLERQARMCLKSPPTSLPFFTVTFPPSRIADTSLRRTFGLGSISFATSRRSTKVPCEWLTRITPRPLLYLRRYVRQALADVVVGRVRVERSRRRRRLPSSRASVPCR